MPYQGNSLNSEALPRPKLQSNVFDMLVKFRKGTVALAGDISQMYHQHLCIDLDLTKEPEVYKFVRFVFGGCSCPFSVQFTWQKHAQDHKVKCPLAANALEKHCYMDDIMPSVNSVETAKETRQQLSEMGNKAGFQLCKWVSNHTEVLKDVPEKDCSSNIDLEKNQLPVAKTLGV